MTKVWNAVMLVIIIIIIIIIHCGLGLNIHVWPMLVYVRLKSAMVKALKIISGNELHNDSDEKQCFGCNLFLRHQREL